MKQDEYIRQARRRADRAAAEFNATMLRAADKYRRVLDREITEMQIRWDRKQKGVRR